MVIAQKMHAIVAEIRSLSSDGRALRKCDALDVLIRESQEARPAPPLDWQDISTLPVSRRDDELFFWIVPKTPEEAYGNTSGDPIFGTFAPHLHRGKWLTWSSLSKATHWREMFEPPLASPTAAHAATTEE